jgi:subtilisin family serine protease
MPELAEVVQAIEIQRPHGYLVTAASAAVPSATPPATPTPVLLLQTGVEPLVRGGLPTGTSQGDGVRVAMVDSGFDCRHAFFQSNGFKATVRLAFMASNVKTDPEGHGTAMCSNFFVLAPKAKLTGVKVHNDEDPELGSTTLEGIQRAIRLRPRPKVISMSIAIDLRDANGRPDSVVTGDCLALQGELEAALNHADAKKRIVFVCSAGNGEFGFPGQMPGVIAVGGVFSDSSGQKMQVAGFSSAFTSTAFPGRVVPDLCSVLGLLPQQTQIMLPVPGGSERDKGNAPADGTSKSDGWTVMGGTSATAPQVAAVCALILEAHPKLSPAEVKALLVDSAIPVVDGGGAVDVKAGAGMVNAAAALALAATRFP